MENNKAPRALSARDLADTLGIALGSAYKLMQRPDFPSIKVSERRIIVMESALNRWLEDQAADKEKAGHQLWT